MTTFQIQCYLGILGYLGPGDQDDDYGPATTAAVKKFQNDYGLTPDGIAGAMTEKMLIGAAAGTVSKKNVANTPVETEKNVTGTFWDSIRYFKREEFHCQCGGRYCNGYPAEMCETVVRIADAAREHFGKPAHVISGLRCPQHNANEGGVANSQHCSGGAIDLRIDGVDSETLRQFVSQQPGHRYSYCINSTNVHFDVPRGSK